MRAAYRISLFVGWIAALISSFPTQTSLKFEACAQSIPCVNPPVKRTPSGQPVTLPPKSQVTIYIDPTFSTSEINDIKAAAAAWLASGAFGAVGYRSSDPGVNAGNNNIRITQGGSGGFLAQTSPLVSSPTTIVGANITFDRNLNNSDGSRAYSPGNLNGGDAFMTVTMEHELGHVLGLDDFHDASGHEIDSPGPTVMGGYRGTNNRGIPPTATTLAAPPGNVVSITSCDITTILANQKPAAGAPGGGGGQHHPLQYAPGTDSGGSGFDWNDVTQTQTSMIIVDWTPM